MRGRPGPRCASCPPGRPPDPGWKEKEVGALNCAAAIWGIGHHLGGLDFLRGLPFIKFRTGPSPLRNSGDHSPPGERCVRSVGHPEIRASHPSRPWRGPLPSFSASPVVGGGGRTKEAASRDCSFTKSHPIEKRGLGALQPPPPLPKDWGNPAACWWGKGLELVSGVPKAGAPKSLR